LGKLKGPVAGPTTPPVPLGRRPLLVLVLAPVIALIAGLLTMGAHADAPRAVASPAGGGCTQHDLKYKVTDDPAELRRQMAFEATDAAVTAPGFYDHAPPATPTLHAASHSSVVVFYRPGLGAERLMPLRALVARALATKAPVIVAPRAQRAAVTALAMGRQLTCTAADAAQTARVRAFAEAIYPSLRTPRSS
jgi:hypothetical protein